MLAVVLYMLKSHLKNSVWFHLCEVPTVVKAIMTETRTVIAKG